MKRLLLSIFLTFSFFICFAKTPVLACEALFDRKEFKTAGYSLIINKSDDNYYRRATAQKDPKLLELAKKLVMQDLPKAYNSVERYEGGESTIILNIERNGHVISVRLSWNDSGYFYIFVQSELEAFE